MSKQKLSPKQEQILEYIKSQILEKGYPPAVREICAAVSLKSTSSVHSHLESLESKGYIRRDPTKPRAIEIIDDDFQLTRREVVNIPIVGTVTAGEPIIATENVEDYFALEVYPHVPDAHYWFDEEKGYGAEIPFTRYFYQYQAPESAEKLLTEFYDLEAELQTLLEELKHD